MTNLFPSELTVNLQSVNEQKIELRVHFLILREKLVSYFASIKKGVTIKVS